MAENGILNVRASEILDSRGFPTVEAELTTSKGTFIAAVPSGSSTGRHEALELRDNNKKRYSGKGVLNAVNNVNRIISKKIIGMDCTNQKEIDEAMIELDGTKNKSKLGANAILAVSMAACKAGAAAKEVPLFKHIADLSSNKKFLMPVPSSVVLEGGKHADNSTDFQEFMIMPIGAKRFSEALRWNVEVYYALGKLLRSKGHNINVGYEGAYAPNLKMNSEPIEHIVSAIEKAGYKMGKEIAIAIDVANSQNFHKGRYVLKKEGKTLSSSKMVDYFEDLCSKYPVASLEDGMAEEDWNGWIELTARTGKCIQIVGDDLTVTNINLLQKAIELNALNSVIIKINQIGTITETLDVAELARDNDITAIVSQRGGETEDTFIADLAVGLGNGQCKFGAPARGERTCKYNRLLRFEEIFGNKARYAGKGILRSRL